MDGQRQLKAEKGTEGRVPTPEAAGVSCQCHVDAYKIAAFGVMP